MTNDERRSAILGEDDPVKLVGLIYEHYQDTDRADQTSRSLMYLHLGLLCGVIMRQARDRRSTCHRPDVPPVSDTSQT